MTHVSSSMYLISVKAFLWRTSRNCARKVLLRDRPGFKWKTCRDMRQYSFDTFLCGCFHDGADRSDTHHPVQPLLPIPKRQDCGCGNGLETLTVVKISNFTAQNALRFCILHQNISLFYYEKSLCELFWVVWSEDEGNFISASGTWNCSTTDYPLTLHWPTSHRPGSRPSPSEHEDLII